MKTRRSPRSAHTPGPWTQSGSGIIRGANGVVVADARTEAGVRSDHERAANVALIVRAPEIPELEAQRDALADALFKLWVLFPRPDPVTGDGVKRDAHDQTEAALRAAGLL